MDYNILVNKDIKENDLKDVCDINEKQMFIKIEKA